MGNISWIGHEYERKDRTNDWFWLVGLIAISGIIISIVNENIMFAIFILIATVCLFFFSIRKPDEATFLIDEKGLHIDEFVYSYSTLRAFWIKEDKRSLLLDSNKAMIPLISIPIPNYVDIKKIEQVLSGYLSKKEIEESFFEEVLERIGF